MNETYLEQTWCFATTVDVSWLLTFVVAVVADKKYMIFLNQETEKKTW